MVLGLLAVVYDSTYFPSRYITHIIAGAIIALFFRAYSQGRKTDRERDLHARYVLVTGGFSPTGLTLLQSLAERGANIIALSPEPVDSPRISVFIDLLRTTTKNEEIYAEHCDLTSPNSIREFSTRFLTSKEQRIDAIIFAHEYRSIGTLTSKSINSHVDERRIGSLATFMLITHLLPALLVAPVERDIRIINLINPFYAAALSSQAQTSKSTLVLEGRRSLRSIVLSRHTQRILDALPTAQIPKTELSSSSVPVVSSKSQKSNIISVSVSPGISRVDTICPLFNADWSAGTRISLGFFTYALLQPILRIFTKSPTSSIQTILHALFLPTPFKVLSNPAPSEKTSGKGDDKAASSTPISGEVLKPGALYSDCAVLDLVIPPSLQTEEEEQIDDRKDAKKEQGELELPDDGELGGEKLGRRVWEYFEAELKKWEDEHSTTASQEISRTSS